MATIMCRAGLTKIGRVLAHARKENERQKVNAVVLVSDACEETPSELCAEARQLVGEACGAGATTLLLAEALDELRGERVRLSAGAVGSPIRISDPADGSFLALIALFRGWTPNKKEAMSS